MPQQTDLVKYEFDPANPPALTEKQQAELAALAALPDEAIDYSDLPAMSEQDWQGVISLRKVTRQEKRHYGN